MVFEYFRPQLPAVYKLRDVLLIAVNQWLQIDVGPPTLVTGIVTKGRGDGRQNQWVVRYRLSYSNDSHVWYFYKDSSQPEVKASRISCIHLLNNNNNKSAQSNLGTGPRR